MITLSNLPDARILRRDLAPADDAVEAATLGIAESDRTNESHSGYGLASVLGTDDRSPIENTELAPWRYVCALVHTRSQQFVGTAWLAGPQLLLTAGHCLYNRRFEPQSLDVIPARTPGFEPFGRITVSARNFRIHPQWERRLTNNRDAGAIRLEEPIEGLNGWFGVVSAEPEELTGQSLNVSGYPARATATASGRQQYVHASQSITAAGKKLSYEIDTSAGQSGGPAFVYDQSLQHPLAIGIHAYGAPSANDFGMAPDGDQNSGTRFDADLMEHIRQWQEGLS